MGICFCVFSVILFEFIREIHQFYFAKIGGEQKFFWEGLSGLELAISNLSYFMASVFVNMMIILILLFCHSSRIQSFKKITISENLNKDY